MTDGKSRNGISIHCACPKGTRYPSLEKKNTFWLNPNTSLSWHDLPPLSPHASLFSARFYMLKHPLKHPPSQTQPSRCEAEVRQFQGLAIWTSIKRVLRLNGWRCFWLLGCWLGSTWKYEFVNWDEFYLPNIKGKHKSHVPVTTNQCFSGGWGFIGGCFMELLELFGDLWWIYGSTTETGTLGHPKRWFCQAKSMISTYSRLLKHWKWVAKQFLYQKNQVDMVVRGTYNHEEEAFNQWMQRSHGDLVRISYEGYLMKDIKDILWDMLKQKCDFRVLSSLSQEWG